MSQSPSHLKQPVGSRWDIEFTRMTQVVRHRVSLCMRQMSALLRQAGLNVKPAFRLHNAGLSGTLTVLGHRGALASFEFNLVDGMADARLAGAALDVNLLASDGEVVAFCSPMRPVGSPGFRAQSDSVLAAAGTALDANALYMLLTKYFDLALERPRAR